MPTSDWGYKPSTGYGLPQHPPGKGPDDSPITPYNFGDQRPVTYVPTNYPVGSVPTLGTVIGPPSELPTFTPDYIANHPNTNKPTTTTKPTGSISFSFGGGGGSGASVPSNVLNTRTFPPYESTWTPPAAVMPEPYNWATRDPYIYGEGLSNAGAAYDIWGSKPGENPYLLSTPESYTPGLLGMQPVQLPANVPSTNVGANINNNINNNNNPVDNRTQKQKEWDRIAAYASYSDLPKQELKMASDQYAARYGNEIFNNDKAKLAQMFPETNWDNFATPELRAKNQITKVRTLTPPPASAPSVMTERVSDKMDRDYSPPSNPTKFQSAKVKAREAVKNSWKPNYDARKGPLRL